MLKRFSGNSTQIENIPNYWQGGDPLPTAVYDAKDSNWSLTNSAMIKAAGRTSYSIIKESFGGSVEAYNVAVAQNLIEW